MSKIKLLLDVVTNMRNLADSLSTLADAVEHGDANPEKKSESESPKVTLEQVRAVLSEKSYAGFTEQVRALINKYGVAKLSEVDPKNYADLLKAAEELS